jgi:hypothetical protein
MPAEAWLVFLRSIGERYPLSVIKITDAAEPRPICQSVQEHAGGVSVAAVPDHARCLGQMILRGMTRHVFGNISGLDARGRERRFPIPHCLMV